MSLENVRRAFEHQGFVTGTTQAPFDLLAESERVFVAVKQFAEIEQMVDQWDSVQARLAVEFYGPGRIQDEKLWDTYLVLVCPGLADMEPGTATKVDGIPSNMAYCRKLLLDTAVLTDETRVRQKLSPLFSIRALGPRQGFNPLDALRQKLQTQGVAESVLALLDETDQGRLVERAKAGAPQ